MRTVNVLFIIIALTPCLPRFFSSNSITSIANSTFTGVPSLTELYAIIATLSLNKPLHSYSD